MILQIKKSIIFKKIDENIVQSRKRLYLCNRKATKAWLLSSTE